MCVPKHSSPDEFVTFTDVIFAGVVVVVFNDVQFVEFEESGFMEVEFLL